MSTNKTVLAIIASGLGTRMSALTGNNFIPKLLVNVGKQTVLSKVLSTYKNDFAHVVIVCANNTHADMIRCHIKSFDYENVSVIVHDKPDGSANACAAVIEYLNDTYHKSFNVVFHWSDVWCDVDMLPIDFNEHESIVALTSNDIDCRLHVLPKHDNTESTVLATYTDAETFYIEHDIISSGLIGIYYVPAEIMQYCYECLANDSKRDFADIMHSIANVRSVHVDNCHSCGDKASFIAEAVSHASENTVRYFNDIKFDNDSVTKTALNERGKSLIAKEQKWYSYATQAESAAIPEVYEYTPDSIVMQRIHGKTVHQFLNDVDINRKYAAIGKGCMQVFKQSIDTLHKSNQTELDIWPLNEAEALLAMQSEYIKTTKERYEEISLLVNDIESFNGEKLPSFDVVMSHLYEYLCINTENKQYALAHWSFIHGDPNTSNTMFNEDTSKCIFIDPRGYFGNCSMTGDIDYDFAKFAYGLTGYDAFNQAAYVQFGYDYDTKNVIANVTGYNIDELDLTHRQKVLVGLIWLKLPAYIKNNTAKAIIAYCHGMLMLKHLLNIQC